MSSSSLKSTLCRLNRFYNYSISLTFIIDFIILIVLIKIEIHCTSFIQYVLFQRDDFNDLSKACYFKRNKQVTILFHQVNRWIPKYQSIVVKTSKWVKAIIFFCICMVIFSIFLIKNILKLTSLKDILLLLSAYNPSFFMLSIVVGINFSISNYLCSTLALKISEFQFFISCTMNSTNAVLRQ